MKIEFSHRFSKIAKILWKSFNWDRDVSSERIDRRTDRRVHMAKLAVDFRNFANAPKSQPVNAV